MHRRTSFLALVLLCSVTAAEAGVWGAKSRHCPRLVTHLTALEADPGVSPTRLARYRNRLADRCVALNEVQVLGSHNSFHIQPRPTVFSALLAVSTVFEAWEYTHLPLDQQFDAQAVRQIELDVFADPAGGLYAHRDGLTYIGEDPNSTDPTLAQPGFKVMHIQDLDFETTCTTFVGCLRVVKGWSDAHPRHLPIMILVEAKTDVLPNAFGLHFAVPLPIGAAELDALDAEIRSVFPPRQLITPDRVRRGRATLEQAVLELGWPRLGSLRGKVLFTLDNGGSIRNAYLAGHASLAGRILFTDSSPGSPEAAFVKENDPLANPATIPALVADGYVARTRADGDTVQARSGDTTMRDAAIASGAQWVSTDYEAANPDFGTGYVVVIPGGSPARCNPISAGPACRDAGLERLP
ncbi:MAG: phosphatidylinositol-specific phospholipase C1-like protein [bacterium]